MNQDDIDLERLLMAIESDITNVVRPSTQVIWLNEISLSEPLQELKDFLDARQRYFNFDYSHDEGHTPFDRMVWIRKQTDGKYYTFVQANRGMIVIDCQASHPQGE